MSWETVKDDAWETFKPDPKKPGWGEGLGSIAHNIGGAVTDAVSRVSGKHSLANPLGITYPPEVAAGFGLAANVATQAIPSILAGPPARAATASITKPAGRILMQSAVKPTSADLISGKAERAVETLLKEGENVTTGGVARLVKQVRGLSAEVDDLIANAEKSGVTVKKLEVAKRAQSVLDDFADQVTPQADMGTIKKAMDEFLNHPKLKDLDDIPVQLAQDMKRKSGSILGSKPYGEVSGASDASQKALIRGLKEEIEQGVPGVKAPNAKQQELLNAIEVMERRAAMSGNKDIAGMALLANDPMAGVGMLMDRNSLFKSILGRFLYSGAPSIMGNTARVGTAGVMATTGQPEY